MYCPTLVKGMQILGSMFATGELKQLEPCALLRCCTHLAVAIREAKPGEAGLGQGHILEALGPKSALESDVVDAERTLGVFVLASRLVDLLQEQNGA